MLHNIIRRVITKRNATKLTHSYLDWKWRGRCQWDQWWFCSTMRALGCALLPWWCSGCRVELSCGNSCSFRKWPSYRNWFSFQRHTSCCLTQYRRCFLQLGCDLWSQVSVLMKVAEHVLDGQQLSGLVMVLQLKFEPVINSKENIYIIINLSHLSKAAYNAIKVWLHSCITWESNLWF